MTRAWWASVASRIAGLALGAVLIAAVGLNVANIFGRYVIGRAIIGADEVLVYTMMGLVFFGAIIVTARDTHLRVSLLPDSLSERKRRYVRQMEFVLLCGVTGGVSWLASNVVLQMYRFDMRSLAAGIPMSIPHAVVAFSLGVVALIALYFAFVYPHPSSNSDERGGSHSLGED